MNIVYIAWSMTIILLGLLLIGKYIIPKEKKKSNLEAKYAEALFKFKNTKSENDKKEVIKIAEDLRKQLGLSKDAITKLLNNDLKII